MPTWKTLLFRLLTKIGYVAADFAKEELAKKVQEMRTPEGETEKKEENTQKSE